ncbi:MAG: sigma-70 family RNA polymerase sigma factor [Eubacteriales bacterium]|nr:sigma-70 family RNA polymerase sigma factor [Eubacteriales bacterium]
MEDLKKPEVFAEYYESVYKQLYRFALCTLGNPQDAEDIVGETVMDAFASIDKLRDPKAFKGWIFKILSNKCKRKLKEYTNKTVELPEHLFSCEGMEERIQVRQAFSQLPEDDRLLISMKVFGGYKSCEIGDIMHMNENTVRSRISRSLGKMRELLK